MTAPRPARLAVAVTFERAERRGDDAVPATGFVTMSDGTTRPFSGWMDLLSALESVAARLTGRIGEEV